MAVSLPAPESYQGDNDGEATGIAPVIHTIDLDGTERWFDLNGRQLSGKETGSEISITYLYINDYEKDYELDARRHPHLRLDIIDIRTA